MLWINWFQSTYRTNQEKNHHSTTKSHAVVMRKIEENLMYLSGLQNFVPSAIDVLHHVLKLLSVCSVL